MNRRLASDQITESDPKFPKRLFPSQTQCPNCYLPGIRNIDELSDHESPWNSKECLLFLSSYYSRYQIVPIDQTQIVINNPNEQDRHQVDEPHIPDANVDHKLDEIEREDQEEEEELKKGEEKNNQLPNAPDGRFQPAAIARDKPNLGLEAIDNEMARGHGANKSDSALALMFILVCFASFGIIYIYFTCLRRAGGKSKKHIIWLDRICARPQPLILLFVSLFLFLVVFISLFTNFQLSSVLFSILGFHVKFQLIFS